MIQRKPAPPVSEPAQGKPVASAEQWLGRDRSDRRQLWERLNPRHRKILRLLARAFVLHQEKARLPEATRARLAAALDDLERLARRVEQLVASIGAHMDPPE